MIPAGRDEILFRSASVSFCNYFFLLPGHKHEVMFAKIGNSKIWENCTQKLLGIIIDRNLKFDEYIQKSWKKN